MNDITVSKLAAQKVVYECTCECGAKNVIIFSEGNQERQTCPHFLTVTIPQPVDKKHPLLRFTFATI